MTTRTSSAEWKGTLKDGTGTMKLASGAYEGPFTFASRFESGKGTNPEELIGAAHAGCFSMFLSALLGKEGFTPTHIHTTATVHLNEKDLVINLIELNCEAEIPGLSAEAFQEKAAAAKAGCPVSKLLAGAEITLTAVLK